MSIYLQHFNREILFKKVSELTVVQSVQNKKAKYFANELLDRYSKKLNRLKLLVKDVNLNYENSFDYVNLMLIDSFESFEKINAGPVSVTQDFSEYYIIIYYSTIENPENEIQKIFNYCWHFYTLNVVLLLQTETDTPIKLYTYYPFTENLCKYAQMRIINYKKSIEELKSSDIFPDKFKSFYNCTLMAALWNVPPYLMLPGPGSGTKELAGFEGYLLNILSQVLEFKIDYLVPPNNEQRGFAEPDGRLTGSLKMLNDRTADLSLGSFRCTLERSTILSPSMTFYQTQQIFTVLSLQPSWSSLEIILFPFQMRIWIILVLLITFLLTSPWILKFYFPNALKFIYGFSSIQFINTNIVAIILNQNANFVPKRNFARFILLMWILLTMILRSIYQGALYNFLTTKQSKAPPDTVADLVKLKYKLIINMATNNTLSDVSIIRDKLIQVFALNITDQEGFPLLEANPDERYVTANPKDFLTHYISTHNKYAEFHILKETIFVQQLCIYFTKHSYLVYIFDRILERLKNFGLIDYWARILMDNHHMQRGIKAPKRTSLTLAQLSGIFKMCLGLYFFAVIVFLCEIFWFYLKRIFSDKFN